MPLVFKACDCLLCDSKLHVYGIVMAHASETTGFDRSCEREEGRSACVNNEWPV